MKVVAGVGDNLAYDETEIQPGKKGGGRMPWFALSPNLIQTGRLGDAVGTEETPQVPYGVTREVHGTSEVPYRTRDVHWRCYQ